jgi:hypothetical protein
MQERTKTRRIQQVPTIVGAVENEKSLGPATAKYRRCRRKRKHDGAGICGASLVKVEIKSCLFFQVHRTLKKKKGLFLFTEASEKPP